MAKSEFATPEINLMPGDDLENKPQGKFLKWALGWGKRIVMLTELIVILAFLSRFWLDTTVADLTDKITQKKAVVVSSSAFEQSFRGVAKKVNVSLRLEKSLSAVTIYDQAKLLIPTEVVLNEYAISDKTVSFTGTADETVLARLVSAFKDSSKFTDVTIERIASKNSSSNVDFALSATYANTK